MREGLTSPGTAWGAVTNPSPPKKLIPGKLRFLPASGGGGGGVWGVGCVCGGDFIQL